MTTSSDVIESSDVTGVGGRSTWCYVTSPVMDGERIRLACRGDDDDLMRTCVQTRRDCISLLARLHIVYGGQTSNGRWRLSSSSVTLHGGSAGVFTRAGQAMTSCCLQSNYSSTVTLHGGPVVLRPARSTPCYIHVGVSVGIGAFEAMNVCGKGGSWSMMV